MDKQTLSNYGWVVIVTLILAVMLALATPFGTYVGDGVVSIANGFVGTSNDATAEENISQESVEWAVKTDHGIQYNTFKYYGTIEEAINAVNSNNYVSASKRMRNNSVVVSNPDNNTIVVRLLKNIEINSDITIKKDVIIDCNDYGINANTTTSVFTVQDNASLTLMSRNKVTVKTKNSHIIDCASGNGNIVCNNINFETSGKTNNGAGVDVFALRYAGTGKVEIEKCDFNVFSAANGACVSVNNGALSIHESVLNGHCDTTNNVTLCLHKTNSVKITNTKINTVNDHFTDAPYMRSVDISTCNNINIKNTQIKHSFSGSSQTGGSLFAVKVYASNNIVFENSSIEFDANNVSIATGICINGPSDNNVIRNVTIDGFAKNANFLYGAYDGAKHTEYRNSKFTLNADDTVSYSETVVTLSGDEAKIVDGCELVMNGGRNTIGLYAVGNSTIKVSNTVIKAQTGMQTKDTGGLTGMFGNIVVGKNVSFLVDSMTTFREDNDYISYTNNSF